MSALFLLPHCAIYSCLQCNSLGSPMVYVTGQQSTILDTVKHRNSPFSCHVSLCAWVRLLTAMPGMLRELITDKVFDAQETCDAAWVQVVLSPPLGPGLRLTPPEHYNHSDMDLSGCLFSRQQVIVSQPGYSTGNCLKLPEFASGQAPAPETLPRSWSAA